jgi:hypothetical protein
MNNRSCNLNGSNMYDPWVIQCVVKPVSTNLIIRDTNITILCAAYLKKSTFHTELNTSPK